MCDLTSPKSILTITITRNHPQWPLASYLSFLSYVAPCLYHYWVIKFSIVYARTFFQCWHEMKFCQLCHSSDPLCTPSFHHIPLPFLLPPIHIPETARFCLIVHHHHFHQSTLHSWFIQHPAAPPIPHILLCLLCSPAYPCPCSSSSQSS